MKSISIKMSVAILLGVVFVSVTTIFAASNIIYQSNVMYQSNDGVIGYWKKIDNNWYYMKPSGEKMKNTFVTWDNHLYRMDNDGKMMSGWFNDDNDDTYYFALGEDEGGAYKGTIEIGGTYYCFDENFKLIKSRDENSLHRLNDTNYYVYNTGIICKKVNNTYITIYKDELDPLYGLQVTTENLKWASENIKKDLLITNQYEITELNKSIGVLNRTYKKRKSAGDIFDGNLLVFGDSNAYRFVEKNDLTFPYVVHSGYRIEEMKNEFMELVEDKAYKYVFFFIGANDFVQQTPLRSFKNDLYYIVNKFKEKGIKPIFTTYIDVDYDKEKTLKTKLIKQPSYARVMKEVVKELDLYFLDISDVVLQYGKEQNDFIHPAFAANKPIMAKLINFISHLG